MLRAFVKTQRANFSFGSRLFSDLHEKACPPMPTLYRKGATSLQRNVGAVLGDSEGTIDGGGLGSSLGLVHVLQVSLHISLALVKAHLINLSPGSNRFNDAQENACPPRPTLYRKGARSSHRVGCGLGFVLGEEDGVFVSSRMISEGEADGLADVWAEGVKELEEALG